MASISNSPSPTIAANSTAFMPWVVCLSAALFFFYEFVQLNMFDAISSNLMLSFGITGSQLGDLSSTFLYANMLFLYPAGIMLDHLSTRKIIVSAMGICVISTFIFALAPNLTIASVAHFLAGTGNAFCFLSCMILASRWFPAKRLAFVTGIMVTIAMMGGAMAHTPLVVLTQTMGWRHATLLNGILGVALFIMIWWFVRDAPSHHQPRTTHATPAFSLSTFMNQVRASMANPQNWKCGIFISALNMPLMVLGALWGSLYLHQVDGFTTAQASTISSMIFLGTIAGSPLFGALSDKMERRKLPMTIGALLSLITFLVIMFIHNTHFNLALILFFALGFFTSAQIIGYPTIAESNPTSITGTSLGLSSILIMGGAGICQQLFGFLIDYFWDHKLIHHVPFYSKADYQMSLMIFPVVLLLGLIMAISIKETYCSQQQS